MHYIIIGLFVLLIDYIIEIGPVSVNLLPDAVGYFVLVKGVLELEKLDKNFSNLKKPLLWASAVMGIHFILALFGFIGYSGLTGIMLTFIELLIVYTLVQKILDMEESGKVKNAGASVLSVTYPILVFAGVARHLYIMIPMIKPFGMIGWIMGSSLFLISLMHSKRKMKQDF